ncbi:hypothetical protein EASAB2608_06480 [Streptomyces sp. EAS-AB2608]|uniref:DUF1648 domain-containing protein n=1 Tax=Streptomyces sp. EAS-AB2608 TaxID=2779671 RepID=UPI001BF01181|nr:DUF1648 domain-containing protein [Streptomyces sp. EAS-AB2608]BCM71146.1 hypothetical protein EASAB2608_06480 [Streptomyces sp. EAS-AB2608]
MTDRAGRRRGAAWGVAASGAGVLALLIGLPLAARGRLPDPLATHWSAGSGRPDGSLPLWAAALVPALVWAVLTAAVALTLWRSGARALPRWAVAGLGCGAVTLVGAQVSVVRANLDRPDWHAAGSVTGWAVGTLVVAAVSAVAAVLAVRREPAVAHSVAEAPTMEVPPGQRFVWLSRTSNPWLQAVSAVLGLLAGGAAVAVLAGLTDRTSGVTTAASLAVAAVLVLCCSSVQARVSERGLEVAFGPFGRPRRRWTPDGIASARAEHRTPAQVGGWGYRLSGLGTTVMLRGGACLVVRSGTGREFAVSVDDAERGAALLNAVARRTG